MCARNALTKIALIICGLNTDEYINRDSFITCKPRNT